MPHDLSPQTQPTSHEPTQGPPSDAALIEAPRWIANIPPWQIRLLYRMQVTGGDIYQAASDVNYSRTIADRLLALPPDDPFSRARALVEQHIAAIPPEVAKAKGAHWVGVVLDDALADSQRLSTGDAARVANRRLYLEAHGAVGNRGTAVQVNVLNAGSAMWEAWQREQGAGLHNVDYAKEDVGSPGQGSASRPARDEAEGAPQ